MSATLLVLAGGHARRMGRPKETLPWQGSTLIERKVAELASGFDEILIATSAPDRLPLALRPNAIADRRRDAGPLAGLEAGLEAARNETVLAIACDMPHVDLDLVTTLLDRLGRHDAVVPYVGVKPDPLCAAYSRRALVAVRKVLDAAPERGAPAASLLRHLEVRYLGPLEFRLCGLEPRLLWNLNTPLDYQVLITAR